MLKSRLKALGIGLLVLAGGLLAISQMAEQIYEPPMANKPLSGFVGLGGAPALANSTEWDLVASHDFIAYRFGALQGKSAEVDSLLSRNLGLMIGTYFNINSLEYWMADEAAENPAKILWEAVIDDYRVYTTTGDTASITGNDPLFTLETKEARAAVVNIIADYVEEYSLDWILLDYCPTEIYTNEADGDNVNGTPDHNGNLLGYYADSEDQQTVLDAHSDFVDALRDRLSNNFLIIANGGRGLFTVNFMNKLDGVYLTNFPATYFSSPSENYDYALDIEEENNASETTLKTLTNSRYYEGFGYVMIANSALHGSASIISAMHDGAVYIEEDLTDPDVPTVATAALDMGLPLGRAVRADISGGFSLTRTYEEGYISIEVVSNLVDSYIDGEEFYNDVSGGGPPGRPANFSIDAYGNTTLEMSWDAVASADIYNIYRGPSSGEQGATPVGTSETTNYVDYTTNYDPHYYTVAAVVNNVVGPEATEIRGYANEWTHGSGECLESRVVHLALPDFGPGGIVGADSGAVDFAFIYDEADGTFHIWNIPGEHLSWGGFTSPEDATWFEHYTSTTLEPDEWVRQPNLDLYDATYGVTNNWAPHVINYMGLWYMSYTSVDNRYGTGKEIQRIMMTTSEDLVTWTEGVVILGENYAAPASVYRGVITPFALWGSGASWTNAMRDAHILRNENSDGWLMFVSLTGDISEIGLSGMVIGLAESLDRDYGGNSALSLVGEYLLYDWVTSTSVIGDAESPQVWEENGTYFLQHSTNTGGTIGQVIYSTTPSDGDRDGSSGWSENVQLAHKGLEALKLRDGEYILAWLEPSWIGNANPTNGWEYYEINFERMYVWDDNTLEFSNIMTTACFEGDPFIISWLQLDLPVYGAWGFDWPLTPDADDWDAFAEYDICLFHAQPFVRAHSTYEGFVDSVRTRNEDWIPITYCWVMGARTDWENSSGIYKAIWDLGDNNSDGWKEGFPGGKDGVLDFWAYDADGLNVDIEFTNSNGITSHSNAFNWAAPGFADSLANLYISYMETGDNIRDYVGVFFDWLYYPDYPTWCFPGGSVERDNIDFNENGIPYGDEPEVERALMLEFTTTIANAFRVRSGNENFLAIANGNAGWREVTAPYFDGAMFEDFHNNVPNNRTELLMAFNDVPGWTGNSRVNPPLLWYQAADQDSLGPTTEAIATIGKGITTFTGSGSEFVELPRRFTFGERIDNSVTVSATGDTSFAKFFNGGDTTYVWVVSQSTFPFPYLITKGSTGIADADTVARGSGWP